MKQLLHFMGGKKAEPEMVYVVGNFTSVGIIDNDVTTTLARGRGCRMVVTPEGNSVLDSWNPGANNVVHNVITRPENLDFSVDICGEFWQLNGTSKLRVGTYNRNADTNALTLRWNGSATASAVYDQLIDTHNDVDYIYYVGAFTNPANRAVRYSMAPDRYNQAPSNTFNLNHHCRGLASDEKFIYFVGIFSNAADSSSGYLNRPRSCRYIKNSDGTITLDSWTGHFNLTAWVCKVDESHLYIGSSSTSPGRLRRWNKNNDDTLTLDSWNPDCNSDCFTISLDNTFVYAGGAFATVQGATARGKAARWNKSTGILDSWNPDCNGTVRAIHISNNYIYLGGDFTTVQGQDRLRACRFIKNSDGTLTLDSWNPQFNNSVYGFTTEPVF